MSSVQSLIVESIKNKGENDECDCAYLHEKIGISMVEILANIKILVEKKQVTCIEGCYFYTQDIGAIEFIDSMVKSLGFIQMALMVNSQILDSDSNELSNLIGSVKEYAINCKSYKQ